MRCSFVPIIPFSLEGGIVVLVVKWLSGFLFFLLQNLSIKWSPFEISVFIRKKICELLEVLKYPHEETLTSFKRFLQGDGKVGRTLGDYCSLGSLKTVISVLSYFV